MKIEIDDFPRIEETPQLKVPAKRFPKGAHLLCGYTSDDGQWFPFDKYKVNGGFELCDHSKRFDSHLRRFYSMSFARLLKTHHPRLYERIHKVGNPLLYLLTKGVDPKSDRAMDVIAEHVRARMEKS